MGATPARIARLAIGLLLAGLLAGRCGSPTAPDHRTGPITVTISCTPNDTRVSTCSAQVSCGLYGCPPNTPADATSTSTWTSDNPAIARIISPGVVAAVAPGDTAIRASHPVAGEGSRSISVFPGTAPLATSLLSGTVLDGSDPARPPLNGATVQILNGLVAGRTGVSGVAPPFMPGFWQPSGTFPAGMFEIFGVPPDSYRLRVFKPGYVTQERDVAALAGSSFVLQPQ